MKRVETLQGLQRAGIVAVMRKMKPDTVSQIVTALHQAGIEAVEITVEQADGFACIQRLKEQFDRSLLIGAGTVLDAPTAKRAIEAGADFIVTPVVKEDVVKMANRYGVAVAAGAMTPTEILAAYELGADVVKVFPAATLGPDYFKHVKGPLGHIPLMPTGGVDLHNMEDYFRSGAVSVGIGSALYNYQTPQEIEQAARQFVERYRQICAEQNRNSK
ncbi:bifunctional 4-hydroxy-2-oxoglutarate aldolase/2-dehydro-3-deoxy-phosphogluconate aldolase [Brevibacillus humidisoli]|uniref:bifunctional 4-hydroxy-2-oxoglutarate aldolase/2-dehydro-3-deoxy-phosphogluconate aldolase n=1 Tax=Brevibacillus humidisoli TaxID=2895522 RepID=UPI001E5690E8|nr:bifunctional 4-hydroxy-2-oxoglutarate aldolase/2-dehydro-3-deoxy-phosphogluconate aldolase [Brevibacillus humidisoli]UFJ40290.1 bifunctional 4-hydroxy-2-oxoglutarate aldolase/2-dehydro-3-deoxy-phosphogluconate aldolase [Brevibacillus humidisoli]